MHPAAAGLFPDIAGCYLDTASYGVPPAQTVRVMREALEAWSSATADWIVDWDPAGDACRQLAAQVFGAPCADIALIPAVSVGAAVALGHLCAGDEVLVPDDEFASVLLPALVSAAVRGVDVKRVAFEELADSVSARTAVVVTSHVRSNDGRVQDLAAVAEAAHQVGAVVVVDATHSAGVLQVEAQSLGLDYVLAAAYKHLLCPRGVAFMRVAPERWSATPPLAASWRSAAGPYDHYYGGDLAVLAPDAARFDISLAWHPWLGARASLEFLTSIPAGERRAWCVGLADDLADRLGVQPTGSSVLVLRTDHPDRTRAALRASGITASGRGASVRLSCHLYNDEADLARVTDVLRPLLQRPPTGGATAAPRPSPPSSPRVSR